MKKDSGFEGAIVLEPNPPGIYLMIQFVVLDYAISIQHQ